MNEKKRNRRRRGEVEEEEGDCSFGVEEKRCSRCRFVGLFCFLFSVD